MSAMRILYLFSFFLFSFTAPQVEGGLPQVLVRGVNGKSIKASEISNDGKPIIVCIWEMSCAPCIHEFDNISKRYEIWQKETGVKLVAISIDDNRNYSRIVPLIKSKGWPFDFYQDKNQDMKRDLGISVCPATLILNSKGEIVWRKTGYLQGDEDIIYEMLLKIIKGEKID